MNVVLVSNYLNHHQMALAEAFISLGHEFKFISTRFDDSVGYQKNIDAEYVVKYSGNDSMLMAKKLTVEADIAIFGAASYELLKCRMNNNRVSFIYSERIFKESGLKNLDPRKIISVYRYFWRYRKKNVYVLCASAFLISDLNKINFPTNRCFKWGYFPEVRTYRLDTLFASKEENNIVSILWAGRLLTWKHPDAAILLAEELKQKGYIFELNIVGDGGLKESLQSMINEKNLQDCVHMLGSMTPEGTRDYMEKADIFLFTSDRNEGWGAVLNESMNSGCAVVANSAIGSVPYLIENLRNGIVYSNQDELFDSVKLIIKDRSLRVSLGRNAYNSIVTLWNSHCAAERLVRLFESISESEKGDVWEDGPCSLCVK